MCDPIKTIFVVTILKIGTQAVLRLGGDRVLSISYIYLWICKTCDSAKKIPIQAKANGLTLDEVPQEAGLEGTCRDKLCTQM